MLRVTIEVTDDRGGWKTIEVVNIVNIGPVVHRLAAPDLCNYSVSTKDGHWRVRHHQSDGAVVLAHKALEAMPYGLATQPPAPEPPASPEGAA